MNLCEKLNIGISEVNAYMNEMRLLRESLRTADTKEKLAEIKKRYKELESSQSTEIANKIAELKEISEAMKALDLDYQDSIATLEEFKVIERRENGEIFYKGDYDPSKEKGYNKNNDSKNKHYLGKEYTMPTLEEIFAKMTPEKIKLYAEMKDEGLEPRLQLAPIAKTIRGLAKHIDDYKGYPQKTRNTYVDPNIIDEELIYEPEDYETSEDGKELITNGGKSKSKWIDENNGWIVDIVATVEELEADPEIKTDANNKEYTNAVKAKMYHKKYKKRGYRGMSYESYAVAEMRALRKGKPLESRCFSIFTDSSTRKTSLVSYGGVYDGTVDLNYRYAVSTHDCARCRPAVRVP
jgi:hypothetical protein